MKNLVITKITTTNIHSWYSSDVYDMLFLVNSNLYKLLPAGMQQKSVIIEEQSLMNSYYSIKEEFFADNMLFIEENIIITEDDITSLFQKAIENQYELCSPSCLNINHPNKDYIKLPKAEYRITNYVNFNCFLITRELFKLLRFYPFEYLEHRETCNKWTFSQFNKIGIIDSIGIYDIKPYSDVTTLDFKIHIEIRKKEFAAVIMYYDDDIEYLADCIESLPSWFYFCLVKTKLGTENKIRILEQDDDKITAELEYDKLHFANMRNLAKSILPTHIQWILSIDPDERIATFQHNLLKNILKLPEDVWGVQNRHIMFFSKINTGGKFLVNFGEQIRIFRNLPEIKYFSAIHETVQLSIKKYDKLINDCGLIIHGSSSDSATRETLAAKHKLYYKLIMENAKEYVTPDEQEVFEQFVTQQIKNINNLKE